ncbi:MAG: hypothetical protein KGI43_10690 [Alphaproteobacteria bacterium]|nr:hypothetical protein [Alphaproteobacteria bacterium]
MPGTRFVVVALVVSLALAACRNPETPQVTHWYGGTPVTTGVYSTPESYRSPTN